MQCQHVVHFPLLPGHAFFTAICGAETFFLEPRTISLCSSVGEAAFKFYFVIFLRKGRPFRHIHESLHINLRITHNIMGPDRK